jgi:hypothetical protein
VVVDVVAEVAVEVVVGGGCGKVGNKRINSLQLCAKPNSWHNVRSTAARKMVGYVITAA